jgi:hypothetical protein
MIDELILSTYLLIGSLREIVCLVH